MAANQTLVPMGMPFIGNGLAPSATTFALSTAANAAYLAYSFTEEQAKTLTDVWAFCSTVTGSLVASDATCEIQTDSSGHPSGSNPTGGGAVVASATPTTGTWIHFVFSGVTLAAGTAYWMVFKNVNATPTSNFPTYQWLTSIVSQSFIPGQPGSGTVSALYSVGKLQSTNSGGAWSQVAAQMSGWRIGYSDSTYDGLPTQAFTGNPTDAKVFNNGTSSQEAGMKFTWPANATGNLKAVAFFMSGSNAPVGPLEFALYEGSSASTCTLKAVTQTCTATQTVSSNNIVLLKFASDVTLVAGTVYRLVLRDTASTGSSSKYFTPAEITIDSNCPSSLLPFDGTLVKTVTTAGATALNGTPVSPFTDSSIGTLMIFALLLDTNGEFASSGGGGGVMGARIFTGQ